jgi:hypothetical protein
MELANNHSLVSRYIGMARFTFIVSGVDSIFQKIKTGNMKDISLRPIFSLRKFNRTHKGTLIVINILTSFDLGKNKKVILPDQMIR